MELNNDIISKVVFKVNHAGGSGSCFYLKTYNLFVTNYHVIEGFKHVAIENSDKESFVAHVIVGNPIADIAFLYSESDFSHLPNIEIDSEKLQMGQQVSVAGFPFGMPFTVTNGTISAPEQLIDGRTYIQTDAAVNPGNSGGPIFSNGNKLIGITVSKINDADNMGFGIPLSVLNELLQEVEKIDRSTFSVQCNSCHSFITKEVEYCPSCGNKISKAAFKEQELTALAQFCEEAIENMGIDPIIARKGYESWKFHKGSSEIRVFVYDRSYLFATSPINIFPKQNLEPLLKFLLSENIKPFQYGAYKNEIYISYRVHISDVFSDSKEDIKKNLAELASKADGLDNYLFETFDCKFSEYSKKDAQ